MATRQYQSGCLLEGIEKSFKLRREGLGSSLDGLLRSLSAFEVDCSFDLGRSADGCDTRPFMVSSNMLSRGVPTRLSWECEEEFAAAFGQLTKWSDSTGAIGYHCDLSEQLLGLYFRALHIIDPRQTASGLLKQYEQSWEALGSAYEEDFYYRSLPSVAGTDAVCQLVEPQRDLQSIVRKSGVFAEQRVDFSFEFPYEIRGKKGIILEVDGPQHQRLSQKQLDDLRDIAVEDAEWMRTLRIRTSQWGQLSSVLRPFVTLFEEEALRSYRLNYEQPLYDTDDGLDALQLGLSPFGIARVQKMLAEAIVAGVLDMRAERWTIAVAERDVPCAGAAIRDFERMIGHLLALEGLGRSLPPIDLHILVSDEFKRARLNDPYRSLVKRLEDDHSELHCDLLIDISLLQRAGFTRRNPRIQYDHRAVIRSAHSISEPRRFHTSGVIRYAQFASRTRDEKWELDEGARRHLVYFLRMIFRKDAFRDGQLEILNRALHGDTVIGLLPTGAGKSLTYQLATCLQPGVVIVVDPIKSLMKDQYDGLRKNYIDACDYINSSRKGIEKRRVIQEVEHGRHLLLFVSPERFQMEEFRSMLARMYDRHVFFSYCVIDEVHCVSEWGHDFRTSYLRLGEDAMTHCRTANLERVPLFGLTATASYDVLSDVQRELSGRSAAARLSEDALIRADTVNRDELRYHVVKVQPEQPPDSTDRAMKVAAGIAKQQALQRFIEQIPSLMASYNETAEGDSVKLDGLDPATFFDDGNKNAGLVFCPHRSWYFGVTDRYKETQPKLGVADSLSNPAWRIGTFIGSDSEDDNLQKVIDDESISSQDRFINDKTNLMVATKAFGMGIDKSNIRFTIHLNYPQSVESFVQEAGRAGRDRKLALCGILYDDTEFHIDGKKVNIDRENLLYFHSNSFKGEEKEKHVLLELLRRIDYLPSRSFGILESEILDEFGLDIRAKVWEKESKARMYLNDPSGESCGYVDLRTGTTHVSVSEATVDREDAAALLDFVLKRMQDQAGAVSIYEWALQRREHESADGIEVLLAEHEVGETFQLDVGFENSAGKVEKLALKHRDKADTEKAIYRLSLIGVIDDYTIDYNKRMYRLTITKRRDEDYKAALRDYIRLYYSEVRADEEMARLSGYHGETVIQRCLGFLIDFIYREVASKRREAIDSMRLVCEEGLKPDGSKAVSEYLDLFFNSRYARREWLPEDTQNGRRASLDVAWKYMTLVREGSENDNLKHLRGACVRLIPQSPPNFVFHMLKAFAQLALEPDNERLFEDSRSSLVKGFGLLMENEKMSVQAYVDAVERYRQEILRFQPESERFRELIDALVDELIVTYYYSWLKSYNATFLRGYERRHPQRA